MSRPPSPQPTNGELELLQFLWDHGPSELGAIHQGLSVERKVALTTVATMLTVMLAKDMVKRKRGGRAWVWSANVSRELAAKPIVQTLVDRVFDGSAQRLMTHLVEHETLSEAERQELIQLLSRGRRGSSSSESATDPRRRPGDKKP